MHYLVGFLFIVMSMFSTVAMAEDTEGKITAIDREGETISLDDGQDYKLPGEFDYTALNEGMKVIVLYEVAEDTRFVTDIQESPEVQ